MKNAMSTGNRPRRTSNESEGEKAVDKGWFQTLFLQILKSLDPKISTKPSDSPSKIS